RCTRTSLNVRENAVELVEAVVVDDETALTGSRVADRDARAEFIGEIPLEALHVRVARRLIRRLGGFRREHASDDRFGLAHRDALLRDERTDLRLLASPRQREQRPRVAHLE